MDGKTIGIFFTFILSSLVIAEAKANSIRSQYAQKMISYMNQSANPCEDFYEYACGNWKNTIEEHYTKGKRVNILDIRGKLTKIIEFLLDNQEINKLPVTHIDKLQLARKFYRKCLNSQLYPMRKAPEYLEILRKIGGFPAVEINWNVTNFNWMKMSSYMGQYGIESMIKEDIISEYPFAPYFSIPSFGFDVDLYYENIQNKSSMAYRVNSKRMKDILRLYDVDSNLADRYIDGVFEFLKEILGVVDHFEGDEYKCEDLSETLKDFEKDHIEEQWSLYFRIVWQGHFQTFTEGNTPCLYFYREMNKIIERHKIATANYLALKFLYHMDAHLTNSKFQRTFCADSIKNSMRFLFDQIFMKLFFDRKTAKDVKLMATRIQRNLRQTLQKSSWMDQTTRKAALLKESAMKVFVGRYENSNLNHLLLKELETLKFINGSYEVNRINLKLFEMHMNRFYGFHLHQISNQTKPLAMMLAMEVNAFYYPIDNNIYISAGVLQPPTYHPAWPKSLKYGTLGYIIGHELSHAFDKQGANYDYTGRNCYWWSQKSTQQFEVRSECFVNQFSKFFVPEINRHIDGLLTLNENIADAGGLHLAFEAYRHFVHEESKKLHMDVTTFYREEKMPGLDLSPEQVFFLGTAQIWCSSYSEADYRKEISNTHTIEKYRVNGLMSNSLHFSEAFNCPKTYGDKCAVW